MELIKSWLGQIAPYWPVGAAVVGALIVVLLARYLMDRWSRPSGARHFRRQMLTLILVLLAILVVIIVIPDRTLSGQLLSLFGILVSAAIALSSTTFVGNAMAGMMLRAVRNFRPGDFIRVGDHLGRVSEQGLFHVEIQTEDRDLTTMPNLYLVTNPVKVIRASGTIVSAEVSLGYDAPRDRVEELLLAAAQATELEEPYVHIRELGNYSVSYRIAGLLKDTGRLISTRSRLRAMILDNLHQGGIEIVSPQFMNTRALPEQQQIIPETPAPVPATEDTPTDALEKLVFDKAEEAASIEKLHELYEQTKKELEKLKERADKATTDSEKTNQAAEKERLQLRRKRLEELIKRREAEREQ
jgi:small-conductance mechanosensitive channel